jgi:hypothetical protein
MGQNKIVGLVQWMKDSAQNKPITGLIKKNRKRMCDGLHSAGHFLTTDGHLIFFSEN